MRRRTRKVKVEAQHGGDSCEKKYPTDYTEEIFEPCLSASSGKVIKNIPIKDLWHFDLVKIVKQEVVS